MRRRLAGRLPSSAGAEKKCLVASEADAARIRDLREHWVAWQPEVVPARLVFIDESGSTVAMTRTHARSPRGERTSEAVPRNRGTVTTILGALTVDGLQATMTVEGGTDGDVFAAYVEHVLLPILCVGDLVVLDNAAAHKDPRVKALLATAGAKALYIPPYSPDLNPIELAWAKLKTYLRSVKARTVGALNDAIAAAMKLISPNDAIGWFRHCGYTGHAT
ncbi:MAG: IS630 family transposase [Pseudomonadota bacterium]|nr:IS630 family transposase [Pseudomonadota bacterium]